MKTLAIILFGSWELLRLGITTGFRLKGPYWAWRWQTAFGRGAPPRRELLWSLLRFGHWAGRMRRG